MTDKNIIGGLILLLFSLVYGVMALALDSSDGLAAGGFSPRTLPLILAVAGVLLSTLLMLSAPTRSDRALGALLRSLNWRPAALLCAMMLVYAAIFPYLGFVLSTIVFLTGCMLVLGIRSPWILLLASVPVTLGFWLILNRLLGIYLAPGALFL